MSETFILGLLLLISPLVLLLLSIKRTNSNKLNLPPCPPKLPLIGNLHQLGSLPHRSLRSLANKHGPTMLLQLGQVPTLVVSSPEITCEIMKTKDIIFASRPPSKIIATLLHGSNDIAFAPYGEYWRKARKLCVTHLLGTKMVQFFQHAREEEVECMMANIYETSQSYVNLSSILNMFATNIVTRVVSNDLFRDQEKKSMLHMLIEENSALVGAFHPADFFPLIGWLDIFSLDWRGKRNAKRWDNILEEVINNKAKRLKDDVSHNNNRDFVEVLLSLENDPSVDFPFTRGNIKAILMDMFAAGIDTSYITLEWSMAELVRNPKVMKKLQDEVRGKARGKDMIRDEDLSKMSYLKSVIKEVMRLHPPVPLLLPRVLTESSELSGYKIPKNTRIIINAWALARDPKCWEEPDEFRPERFMDSLIDFKGNDFQFIPFGAGRRICPGMNFAMHNIELALANLVNRFEWSMPEHLSREDLDMNETPGLTSRKEKRLDLVAKFLAVG
ncbi:cytochrome P450 71A1-like isoform X2 [Asparagus officinalis]|uniref:cytochrome P450 71A1-like isoform X2 n=1 Tax=Asparagus officinalis TaxID=4686 RepID=UPI00098E1F70|nr:cytochrome P450 71A1-like isoform X2 [Asparagus officinalis]